MEWDDCNESLVDRTRMAAPMTDKYLPYGKWLKKSAPLGSGSGSGLGAMVFLDFFGITTSTHTVMQGGISTIL